MVFLPVKNPWFVLSGLKFNLNHSHTTTRAVVYRSFLGNHDENPKINFQNYTLCQISSTYKGVIRNFEPLDRKMGFLEKKTTLLKKSIYFIFAVENRMNGITKGQMLIALQFFVFVFIF